MSAVDVVWEQMQRESLQRDVTRVLRKSVASRTSNEQPQQSMRMRKPTTDKREQSTTLLRASATDTSSASSEADTAASDATTCRQSTQLFNFNLQREMNRLADERSAVRKQAALALEAHFLTQRDAALSPQHSDMTAPSDAAALSTNTTDFPPFDTVAKALFKRFNDPVEKVRAVCVRITTRYVAVESDLLRILPYLVPAIVRRLDSPFAYDEAQQEFTRDAALQAAYKRGRVFVDASVVTPASNTRNEPSEEVRLMFFELLAALLNNVFTRSASSILHAYMFDVLVLLIAGVYDPFPDVNVRACALLRAVSDHMVSVMKHFSVACVRACRHLLVHRLARVRLAAIDAVRALVACPNRDKCKGSGTEAIVDLIGHRDDNVLPIAAFYTHDVRINYFAKLNQDTNVLVRKAFFALVSDWLLHLPDRYDHESRLMPYVLSAASDDDNAIAAAALATLVALGARYEREHAEDVLEIKQYGTDGQLPSYNYAGVLPHPFGATRPTLGTRLFVRGRARRFLSPVLRELGNWQSVTRRHAVRLLTTIVVFCEETVTVDAHLLLPTLLREWRVAEIASELQVVAELVGRFVAPVTYLPLVLARIRGDADASAVFGIVAPTETAVALELLLQLLRGSLDRVVLPHVHDVLDAVTATHIVDAEHAPLTLALGRVLQHIAELLQRRGQDAVSAHYLQHGRLQTMQRIYEQLFDAALVVKRAVNNCTDAVDCAIATLDALPLPCDSSNPKTQASVIDAYFTGSLDRATSALVAMSAVHWTSARASQRVVDELLHAASIQTLRAAAPALVELFQQMLETPVTDESSNGLSTTVTPAAGERTAQRTAAYRTALDALLVRIELELPRDDDLDADKGSDAAIATLLALAHASRAA